MREKGLQENCLQETCLRGRSGARMKRCADEVSARKNNACKKEKG